MAVPARLLHQLFAQWRATTNENMDEGRRRALPDSTAAHRAAMIWIDQTAQYLHGLTASGSNVESSIRQLDTWTQWVLNYPRHWGAAGDGVTLHEINDDRLTILDLLASRMESDIATQPAARIGELADTISEAKALLSESTELPRELRLHLHGLISEAERCISEYDTVGDVSLQASIDRLIATAAAARSKAEPDRQGRWENFINKLFWPVTAALAIETGKEVLELTTGSQT